MRVAIATAMTPAPKEPGIPFDELRVRLEQKLLTALESWDREKKRLEEAVARAEEKEHEFRAIAEDVKRRLEALEIVAGMAAEIGQARPAKELTPATDQRAIAATEKDLSTLGRHVSSRPLFTERERHALSILP
jgi:hypothetical protein